jgi:hypothetical protein
MALQLVSTKVVMKFRLTPEQIARLHHMNRYKVKDRRVKMVDYIHKHVSAGTLEVHIPKKLRAKHSHGIVEIHFPNNSSYLRYRSDVIHKLNTLVYVEQSK